MCTNCFHVAQVVPVAGVVGRMWYVARRARLRPARPAEQPEADVMEYAACASTSDQTTPVSN